ncbi:hypothetical protein RHGRI_000676 [Rhododendron griersonianum]|uniref:No apical meristem-associated C-terminal domain-containing protein n=1 Tax=Rhododendron griersonianum TaxID=479676 RepID=A0AAV6LIQ6_9ERIC|nr:hypothetical protein RHGRI_000676 [Rhododendron griersonianum]
MESETQMESENQRKTRKTNYSQYEDEALVKAWLHISGDAVVGRDQKSTKLWMRVLESFHQILGRITERNAQGMQNRWQAISHDVSKFCGYYNKIGRLNPSGWNDQMILDEAKKQYGEIEGPLQAKPVHFCKFKFEHCWKLLNDSPKWNDHVLMRNTSKGCKKPSNPQSQVIGLDDLGTPPPSTTSTQCSIPLDEFKSQDDEHDQVRPAEGRRKTKAKRKNEWRDEESTLFLKSINETLAQTAMIEKEKLEAKKNFEKEKSEAKKRRNEQKIMHEEMKVMRQSMVGLTPEQAAYWKLQQSLIVERYKANGFLTDLETNENNYGFNF